MGPNKGTTKYPHEASLQSIVGSRKFRVRLLSTCATHEWKDTNAHCILRCLGRRCTRCTLHFLPLHLTLVVVWPLALCSNAGTLCSQLMRVHDL
jgi:hypothetical protein